MTLFLIIGSGRFRVRRCRFKGQYIEPHAWNRLAPWWIDLLCEARWGEMQHLLIFLLCVLLCLASEFAGWHIHGASWQHAIRGPVFFIVAVAIVRGLSRG